jgi:ADP-heptose:LPS heptosyltransferase
MALGRAAVAIFGPTNPVWVGLYKRSYAVLEADLACSPCYLRDLSSCPHNHACMNAITLERVIAAMEAKIATTR